MHQQNKSKLPGKLIDGKKYITWETEITKKWNQFFTESGPTAAWKIPTPSKPF